MTEPETSDLDANGLALIVSTTFAAGEMSAVSAETHDSART